MAAAADASTPACWIGPAGCLVDISSLLADSRGGSDVTLMGGDEFDAAVPVSVVVPVHKRCHPHAGLVFAGEWPAVVVGPILDRSEQEFRVGIVVADPWSGEGSENAHLLQA